MTNHEETSPNRCPICELGMSAALTVVSRHRTSTGTVVYARCQCGRLSMWSEAAATVTAPPELRTLASCKAA
ncbi:hypothetical protein [Stackebrandtia nassauensis]|uniref:Uncharacterized protein n=1 Tax=Stackebrandtia nassauensis (strain DSM 44728 / CIP 108903 / NRRL B-16338 / NBRC 102104 / LLR-40K-21) TaxID=446470 RepID=D3Q8H2_STANL|nr:hypothetical protein [Stackebrandtia nassauensis]ADD42546.1 hypothetical protein Snas_2871 [Stackebrandtia nassauensis DSM 44728]